ncbi:low temperature requirement protein A [Micromonospora sp. 067-2]|uniref:low temperature requirement protein A n=1 Tax=Micromonospora sp. 067-2 TaxID=2789270 RepID=UPI00397A09BD
MTEPRSARPFYQPMRPRSRNEPHRSATPLELFFDLCFVVAVAQAAASLHHDVSEGHFGHAVTSYLMVFFAIWWSWMNFTWFASAYYTDDDVYRIAALVQITGALILAAGVPRAFADGDFSTITYGYVVMRLATVGQWVRAAVGDPTHRAAARRYAVGVTLVQIGWLLRLALPHHWGTASFVLLGLADLLVPAVAERPGMTPWHPRHITERYGLFTLIVLGEAVLAISVAIQTGIDAGDHGLWSLAAAGAVIVYAVWWLYFDRPVEAPSRTPYSLVWGYGHYLVFAAIAAVGAGLVVAVDHERRIGQVSGQATGYAVAVPIAVYLLTVWLLHVRRQRHGVVVVAFPVVALLALLAPLGPIPVQVLALLLFVLVALTVLLRHRDDLPTSSPAGADPA